MQLSKRREQHRLVGKVCEKDPSRHGGCLWRRISRTSNFGNIPHEVKRRDRKTNDGYYIHLRSLGVHQKVTRVTLPVGRDDAKSTAV